MELTAATVVTLPAQLTNASVQALRAEAEAAFAAAEPIVVFTGASAGQFCLGLDLTAGASADMPAFADLLGALADAPKLTLAFVDGRAIGGGLGLAAACDWVVAAAGAEFALPELLWGLIPAMIWPLVVARLGLSHARHWTLSAHSRSAAEARAAGLVDEVLSHAPTTATEAPAELRRIIRQLARADSHAVRALRQWARTSERLPFAEALRAGAALTARMASEPAVLARVDAFTKGDAPWR